MSDSLIRYIRRSAGISRVIAQRMEHQMEAKDPTKGVNQSRKLTDAEEELCNAIDGDRRIHAPIRHALREGIAIGRAERGLALTSSVADVLRRAGEQLRGCHEGGHDINIVVRDIHALLSGASQLEEAEGTSDAQSDWQWVPKEPTEAMTKAAALTLGIQAIDNASQTMQARGYPLDPKAFETGSPLQQAYRAFLAAAPAAPVAAQPVPRAEDWALYEATVPDGVHEALQRLIENGASMGKASAEDALLVARFRTHAIGLSPRTMAAQPDAKFEDMADREVLDLTPATDGRTRYEDGLADFAYRFYEAGYQAGYEDERSELLASPVAQAQAAQTIGTPPAAWDEYAMRDAARLWELLSMTVMDDSRSINAIHVALIAAMTWARSRVELPVAQVQGTFACPHCGNDYPHAHDELAWVPSAVRMPLDRRAKVVYAADNRSQFTAIWRPSNRTDYAGYWEPFNLADPWAHVSVHEITHWRDIHPDPVAPIAAQADGSAT